VQAQPTQQHEQDNTSLPSWNIPFFLLSSLLSSFFSCSLCSSRSVDNAFCIDNFCFLRRIHLL
jgi:hypothetical protein